MIVTFFERLGAVRWVAAFLVALIVVAMGGIAVFGVQAFQRMNAAVAAGRGPSALQNHGAVLWAAVAIVALVIGSFIVLMAFINRTGEANVRIAGERDKFAALSRQNAQKMASKIVSVDARLPSAETILKKTCGELEQRIIERTTVLETRTIQLEAEIEERQRVQNQLLQSAKMATIGEMASGITHELNQPMNIIRLGVESALLKIQRGQCDIGVLEETLRKVENQIIRMADIVNHMRAYTRIDTQGQAPFDPLNAVRDACKLFTAQLKGGPVNLSVVTPEYISPVLGHATRLEQVLLNLLSNARESILTRMARDGAGDRVGDRVGDRAGEGEERISVTVREDLECGVIIEVEDTGHGIPADILPHIFAPFVTTKEANSGTGLGLSIIFGIVQSMKGTVEAVSLSTGARFVITLPKADETQWLFASRNTNEHLVRPVARQAAGNGSGRPAISTILVVDDEIGAAQILADFLQEMGYMVYIAYNGEEALELFESDPADAVITDMHMPGMGGEELVRCLHERAPDVPILIMTGGVQDDYKTRSMPPGVTDILYKPFSLNVVAQKLRALNVDDERQEETRNAMKA